MGERFAPDLTPRWRACNFLHVSEERAGNTGPDATRVTNQASTDCGRVGDRETMKTQPVARLSSEAKGVGSFKYKLMYDTASDRVAAWRIVMMSACSLRTQQRADNTASNMNTPRQEYSFE